jgi:PAS domain S-box-containing protein
MNAGGIIQSASDSVEQVFGWTPTELFGKNVKILIPEPRRSALDRYLDRYRLADRSKALKRTRRFEALRKNGTVFQIDLSMSRADLPASAAPFFIGIIRDVSQQIDTGVETTGEQSRLHYLITEQTRALATANLRLHLADRLASLGTLAAGLGHDMNNVLLPVRARLDALEHAGITKAARAHVTAVRQSIAYLQHLSDGLHFLALDPDGPGVAPGEEGTTDLAQWWAQVGALLRKAVPGRVRLQASLPAGLPPVRIAPHWLTQAMLNLIVNAGEAIPDKRRGARVRVRAALSEDGRTVRLGVTDNGRGMSHAVQRRAFDLFFTTKPRSMGTGLGLPLAQKVALRAGGHIEVKSELGKGSTVTLVLPVTTRAVRRAALLVPDGRSAAITVRDPRAAALITHVLHKAGLTLGPANSRGPGKAEVWVTEPTKDALAAARLWRKKRPRHVVVLLGAPPPETEREWTALRSTVIDPPDDFEAIRRGLARALTIT